MAGDVLNYTPLDLAQESIGPRQARVICRWLAFSIDGFIYSAIIYLFSLLKSDTLLAYMLRLILILSIAYPVITVKLYGQTLGKYLMGIWVIGGDGKKIGWFRSIMRETVLKWLSLFLLFPMLTVFVGRKKKTLYDYLLNTEVVYVENKKNTLALRIVLLIVVPIVIFGRVIMPIIQTGYNEERIDLLEEIDQKVEIIKVVKDSDDADFVKIGKNYYNDYSTLLKGFCAKRILNKGNCTYYDLNNSQLAELNSALTVMIKRIGEYEKEKY